MVKIKVDETRKNKVLHDLEDAYDISREIYGEYDENKKALFYNYMIQYKRLPEKEFTPKNPPDKKSLKKKLLNSNPDEDFDEK